MVHTRSQHQQQIVNQHGFEIQVELEGLVVKLDIGHLADNIFEQAFFPGYGWMVHHGLDSVVIFFVFLVQED